MYGCSMRACTRCLARPGPVLPWSPSGQAAIHKVQLQRIDMLVDLTGAAGRYWINRNRPGKVLRAAACAECRRWSASHQRRRPGTWMGEPGVLGMNICSPPFRTAM